MGDGDLSKVQPGDPLEIPAGRANAWTEAARAHREEDTRTARPKKTRSGPAGVVDSHNAGDEVAPMHGVVQVCDQDATQRQVEVCRPGEYDGAAQYGVTVESIPSGSIGRIALSGGPWAVQVAGSVSPGDTVGPVDGQWEAGTDGDALDVCRADVDGEAMVRFRTGGGKPQMVKASQDMTADDTFYDAVPLDSDGTTSDTISVKRPNGVAIDSGQVGYLGQDIGGDDLFIPANMRETPDNPLVIETRTSDPSAPEPGRIWLRTDL